MLGEVKTQVLTKRVLALYISIMVTQAERRESTQRALLDAAAARLVAEGLAGFTTAGVAGQAELSSGALFRHFPTRLVLLTATVDHVLRELRDEYVEVLNRLEGSPVSFETLLDILWLSMSDPRLAAVYEVYAKARTDDELLVMLQPIVSSHSDYVQTLVYQVLATVGTTDTKRLAELTQLALSAMQGLVISQMAGTALGEQRDLLRTLLSLVIPFEQKASSTLNTAELAADVARDSHLFERKEAEVVMTPLLAADTTTAGVTSSSGRASLIQTTDRTLNSDPDSNPDTNTNTGTNETNND